LLVVEREKKITVQAGVSICSGLQWTALV
jgi:hypothetical protein